MKMKRFRMNSLLLLLLFMATPSVQAQSLKDLFNKENIEKAVGVVTGKNTASMVGNWVYTGSDGFTFQYSGICS